MPQQNIGLSDSPASTRTKMADMFSELWISNGAAGSPQTIPTGKLDEGLDEINANFSTLFTLLSVGGRRVINATDTLSVGVPKIHDNFTDLYTSTPAQTISHAIYESTYYFEGNTSGMDSEATLIQRSPKMFMWYPDASNQWAFELAKCEHARTTHDALPHLCWEWFQTSQYAEINAGTHDAYIDAYAAACASWGYPILMRTFHEANGDWYQWTVNSTALANAHRTAWQRIVTRFRNQGADNVTWMYNIVGTGVNDAFLPTSWPGDTYVDVVSVNEYNGNEFWGGNRDAEALYRGKYDYFYDTLGTTRPFAIGESGCREANTYPGGKVGWIGDVMDQLVDGTWPELIHFTTFDANFGSRTDWRVNSSAGALTAYRGWFADPRYQRKWGLS